MERRGHKGVESPTSHLHLLTGERASRVPLEHAEEQSSRARTGDGRWKASRCARIVRSLRGARNVGRVFGWFVAREGCPNSHARIGDQEMLEIASSGGSPL